MERIGLVGINWKREGAAAIAEFSERLDDDPKTLQRLAGALGVTELVCLRTCNRVELAVVVKQPEDLRAVRRDAFQVLRGRRAVDGEAQSALRLWGGEGAVEHIFLVCAGLESARIGEREIVGQVKAAVELARTAGTLGARLSTVFGEALKVAKRVHGETSIGDGRASLAEIGLEKVRTHLTAHPGLTAVVGVGKMSRRSAQELRERGFPVLVVNRTEEAAKELAASCGAQWSTLDRFLASPPPLSALITATGAREFLFGTPELQRIARSGSVALVDLAVPPDIDRESAEQLGLDVLDMDDILEASRITRSAAWPSLARLVSWSMSRCFAYSDGSWSGRWHLS